MYNTYGWIAKWLAYQKTVQKAKAQGSLESLLGGRKCSYGIYSSSNSPRGLISSACEGHAASLADKVTYPFIVSFSSLASF